MISCTDKKLSQYPQLKQKIELDTLLKFKTGITKYTIINSILLTNQQELKQLGFAQALEWRDPEDEKANLSTASLKALKKLMSYTLGI
jgi:predicted GTPase